MNISYCNCRINKIFLTDFNCSVFKKNKHKSKSIKYCQIDYKKKITTVSPRYIITFTDLHLSYVYILPSIKTLVQSNEVLEDETCCYSELFAFNIDLIYRNLYIIFSFTCILTEISFHYSFCQAYFIKNYAFNVFVQRGDNIK